MTDAFMYDEVCVTYAIRIRIVGRFRFDSQKDMKIHVRIHIANVNSRISNTMRTSRLSRVDAIDVVQRTNSASRSSPP